MWLAASAGPSALLLATTNHLCQDVATAPFLWVLPLSAYLVSLIICFDRPQIVRPRLWAAVAIFAITASSLLTLANTKQFLPLLMTDLAVLFSLSMFSHGLLARMRPEGERLPLFYVMVAFGGALGGASVALAAPLVFNRYYEWNFALVAGYLVSVVLLLIREKNQNRATRKQAQRVPAWRRRALAGLLTVGLAGVAAVQAGLFDPQRKYDVLCTRNFYGAVRIAEFAQGDSHHGFAMQHGGVMHGLQFTSDKLRRLPTTYYHPGSGIGQVLLEAKDSKREGRHIGVIGLGTGTLAAYGRSGDTFRFYEIDPQVVGLAKSHFTFLHDSKAACHVALGDARLVLEAEPPRNFDVLVLDAFSGDAIPVHLLTRQAIHVYLRHLKPDGVLAIHVSNKSFNLIPVVAALLNEAGFHARHLRTTTAATPGATTADWILASASPHGLPTQGIPLHAFPGVEPWRDDYSNLFDALDWR